MLDIGPGLAFAHRSQMVCRRYPLPQLFEPRAAEDPTELRLAEQKTLQCHGPVDHDVGEHSELFERFEGQVLRFVDYQQHASTVALLCQYKVVNALQQRSFGQSLLGDAERARDEVQKIITCQLSGDDLSDDEAALIDGRQQIVDEDRFACTDFPGDNDKALGMG